MIIPITTNTTIATCVQIQNGDIAATAYFSARENCPRGAARTVAFDPAFAKLAGIRSPRRWAKLPLRW
jgi:hypothetical protein